MLKKKEFSVWFILITSDLHGGYMHYCRTTLFIKALRCVYRNFIEFIIGVSNITCNDQICAQ